MGSERVNYIYYSFNDIFSKGVSRLLHYLNTQLYELKSIAFKISFDKLIKILWARILDHIELNITSDKSVSSFCHAF